MSWRSWLVRGGLSAGLLLVVAVTWSSLIFMAGIMPGKHPTGLTPADYGLDYERVTLTTADGLALTGWFIPRPLEAGSAPSATVVVGHGYPFDKGGILDSSLFLHDKFNLFYFDLRYFGESQGAHTTFGYEEKKDVAAALAYLKTRPEVDPERIGMFGFSLSAAVFLQARPEAAKAMVLDSPYESLESLADSSYGFLPQPLRWLMVRLTDGIAMAAIRIRIGQVSPLAESPRLRCPVLFIHGLEDRQTPYQDSIRLFLACGSREKQLWLIPGADHGQTSSQDRQAYKKRVTAFFETYLTPTAGGGGEDQRERTNPH